MTANDKQQATTGPIDALEPGAMTLHLGTTPALPTDPGTLLLEVDCAATGAEFGPLVDLLERTEALLGGHVAAEDRQLGNAALWSALRRRLTGSLPAPVYPGRLVGALNRLQSETDRRVVVVFHAIDQADGATLSLLVDVAQQRGWLKPAIIFTAKSRARVEGLAAALVESRGEGAVVRGTSRARPTRIRGVSPEVLFVLRALAFAGERADAPLLARLTGRSELSVLASLQVAIDSGIPVRDLGRGRFSLARSHARSLLATLTPSLQAAWRQVVGRAEVPGREAGPRPSSPEFDAEAFFEQPGAPAREIEMPQVSRDVAPQPAPQMELEEPLERAANAVETGAFAAALRLCREFDTAASKRTNSRESEILEAQSALIAARARWLAPEVAGEDTSLRAALEDVDRGLQRAERSGDAIVEAELRATAAAICYDSGTPADLERALSELTRAIRGLSGARHTVEAACLLSDMAAVWLRIGDPVRANRLLEEARKFFEARDHDDLLATIELAEIDHWSARLILHAKARPGREADAVAYGLECAGRAEQKYHQLGDEWMVARVWETIGRLERLRGRSEVALEVLQRCVEVQVALGDVIGLARSTAGLSDLLVEVGDHESALIALRESIELNDAKGSLLGLAFNRRALKSLGREVDPALLAPLEHRFQEVTASVGAVAWPNLELEL